MGVFVGESENYLLVGRGGGGWRKNSRVKQEIRTHTRSMAPVILYVTRLSPTYSGGGLDAWRGALVQNMKF